VPSLLNQFGRHVDELDLVTIPGEPVGVVARATTNVEYPHGRIWQDAAQLLYPGELEFPLPALSRSRSKVPLL
jgi:hypothetical protein